MVGSRSCIHFQVATLAMAEQVVNRRHVLKDFYTECGCQMAIFDVLSSEEAARHKLLYPKFLAAVKAGHHAQFSRASLRIDGVLMHP